MTYSTISVCSILLMCVSTVSAPIIIGVKVNAAVSRDVRRSLRSPQHHRLEWRRAAECPHPSQVSLCRPRVAPKILDVAAPQNLARPAARHRNIPHIPAFPSQKALLRRLSENLGPGME